MYYRNYYYPQYYSEADLETAFALGYKDASEEVYYYTPQYTDDFLYEAYLMGKQAARDDEESALGAMARGAGSVLVPGAAAAGGGALAAHLIKAPDLSEEAISRAARNRAETITKAYDKRNDLPGAYYYPEGGGERQNVLDKFNRKTVGHMSDHAAVVNVLKDLTNQEIKALGLDPNTTREVVHDYLNKKIDGKPSGADVGKIVDIAETIQRKKREAADASTRQDRALSDYKLMKAKDPNLPDYDTYQMRQIAAEHGIKPGMMTKLKFALGGGLSNLDSISALNNALKPHALQNTTHDHLLDAATAIERGERRLQAAGRLGGIAASAIGSGLLAKGIYDRMVG